LKRQDLLDRELPIGTRCYFRLWYLYVCFKLARNLTNPILQGIGSQRQRQCWKVFCCSNVSFFAAYHSPSARRFSRSRARSNPGTGQSTWRRLLSSPLSSLCASARASGILSASGDWLTAAAISSVSNSAD